MITVVILLVFGLVNVFFPHLVWAMSQFMVRFKNGDLKVSSEESNSTIITIHRVLGIVLLLLAVLIIVGKVGSEVNEI